MDPYLESPAIWPDFHDGLAGEMRAALNGLLPPPYYARLQMRPEIGILDSGERRRRVVPDVAVVRSDVRADSSQVALLSEPRTDVSACSEVAADVEPIEHHFVEIRDAANDHRLVTLIEIVSPSHKRPGPDREAYLQKQREVLASDANLVEIDLLRDGMRLLPGPGLLEWIQQQPLRVDYVTSVSRAWRRDRFQLYASHLRHRLPVVGVPLGESEPPVPLDLQYAVNQAYDRGPYRRGAVDYRRPPDPPLPPEDAAWAEELLRPFRAAQ
jgi:hypothetical protein